MDQPIYEMTVETDAGQFTRASPVEINLTDFTAGGLPIRRLFFYAPGHPAFPQIEIEPKKSMTLTNCKLAVPDYRFCDQDQSHLPAEQRRRDLPLRRFWCIGFTIQNRTALNLIDLETGKITLDLL